MGALIVIFALTPLRDYPPLLFLGAMIFTSVLEYVTSWLMEKLFHSKWWDYSERPFNLNGRICLLNSFLFGVMGLVVMYVVHPLISDALAHIPGLARIIIARCCSCCLSGTMYIRSMPSCGKTAIIA